MSESDGSADESPKLELLHESQLLAGLSRKELDEVDLASVMTRCQRGRVFFTAHDEPETIYFLKEGRVRLYRSSEGKQLTVALLDRGMIFGESSLLGQSHAGVFAEADEECLLCVMPTAKLSALITRIPRIGLNLLQCVGHRLQRSQELAEEVAFWSVRRRLARAILDLDERYGHPTLDGQRIINRAFTQAQIAEMIGSTRETVADLMGELRRSELIDLRKRRIVILNGAALRQAVLTAPLD
ncbi:MAG: Crp/Fnr family transcriptional regulator [Thermoleophilia bacterium]|nr:Crp/Fnr family transcriptional regulator [Thermoleophilia bacterium]